MKISVKVLQQVGEAGLRQPGETYSEEVSVAENLAIRGFVEILTDPPSGSPDPDQQKVVIPPKKKIIKKQDKTKYETKEDKTPKQTKRKK